MFGILRLRPIATDFKWGRPFKTFRRGCTEIMIKSLVIEDIGKEGAACMKLHKIRKYGHLDVCAGIN
jgi:hypothetical protein